MEHRKVPFKEACEWLMREFKLNDNLDVYSKNRRIAKRKKKRPESYLRDFAIREHNNTLRVVGASDGWKELDPDYMAGFVSMENCFSKCLLLFFDRELVEAVAQLLASIANFTFSSLIDTIRRDCGKKGDEGDLVVKRTNRRFS